MVGDAPPAELRRTVAARVAAGGHVHVVAPPVVSPLDWLSGDEDAARREAEVRALETEWLLAGEADVSGETRPADPDPVQAVSDVLAGFPADEILLGGAGADRDLERLLRGFGLPVSAIPDASSRRRRAGYRILRDVAAARTAASPFELFLLVNAVMLLAAWVLSGLALLLLWRLHAV